MKTGAVIGGIATVGIGLAAIILINTSGSKDSGSPVGVGIKKAEASQCKDEDAFTCLPKLDFVDVDGQVFTPDTYEGKVVMINFWATWCGPCKMEVPHLTHAYQKYKDQGFVIYGVMVDDNDNDELERFAAKYKLNYPIIRADYEISKAWGHPRNLPMTFVYDRTGKKRWDKTGVVRPSDMDRIIPELLAEAAPVAAKK